MERFQRSAMLLGQQAIENLSTKKVAVFGIGGVGSYAVEALVRSGVEHFLLVDNDTIAESNMNRQLHATYHTLGNYKTQEMARRILSISPEATVETQEIFALPENLQELLAGDWDYIVDAVDTVSTKIALAQYGWEHQVPVISAMGAGNKLDPTRFQVADLFSTDTCPLCRIMRKELRKREIPALKVVYSTEPPCVPDLSVLSEEDAAAQAENSRRSLPGSVAFVPSVAGLIIAGEVVKDLTAPTEI